MKGIILAGGTGTRLHPITKPISKQLLPIYDKPMIYYPLSVLMLAGIRDILVITTPTDSDTFKELLGNGDELGISLNYQIQPHPGGIAQALIIAKDFIGNDCVCLILGDNLFYGQGLTTRLLHAVKNAKKYKKATAFAYRVANPADFGVVELDSENNAVTIEEKPTVPKTNYAITGLYFYDNDVVEFVNDVKPSSRGELEITSVNNAYIKSQRLSVEILGRGFTWLDAGTCDGLLEASQFVATIEKRQGLKVGCLEEIALHNSWISRENVEENASKMKNSSYGQYLMKLASEA